MGGCQDRGYCGRWFSLGKHHAFVERYRIIVRSLGCTHVRGRDAAQTEDPGYIRGRSRLSLGWGQPALSAVGEQQARCLVSAKGSDRGGGGRGYNGDA